MIEPQVAGNVDKEAQANESLDFAVQIWSKASPIILVGGYSVDKANRASETALEDEPAALASGRHFNSNSDLPFRLESNLDLTQHQRDSFHKVRIPDSYIVYAFSEAWIQKGSWGVV